MNVLNFSKQARCKILCKTQLRMQPWPITETLFIIQQTRSQKSARDASLDTERAASDQVLIHRGHWALGMIPVETIGSHVLGETITMQIHGPSHLSGAQPLQGPLRTTSTTAVDQYQRTARCRPD